MNYWWTKGEVKKELVPQTKRDLFEKIKRDIKRRQIQILIGLRRVGKSTIIYQIIDHLIKEGLNPLNTLYINFDEPTFQEKRIEEILKEYGELTDIDYKSQKIFLFLDEVQKSKNWTNSVKLIYDNFPNIKILASGSASLNILSKARKDLAGRVVYYELPPLNFPEYLKLKKIKFEEKRIKLYGEKLKKEFKKFMLRPFPEIVNEENASFIKEYIRNAVVDPIILKDIPKEFGGVDILLLEKLLNIFLSNPGQYLKVDELAKELRRGKKTIYNAIFYLEFSFLIKRILNFRPSIRAASRKLSRVYAYHPGLLIPFNVPKEKFAENMVMFESNSKYYWREGGKEIDFLKDSIPIEVKFKSKIKNEDLRWVRFFIKKYGKKLKTKEAIVVTKDTEEKIDGIKLIPLWKFCLISSNQNKK